MRSGGSKWPCGPAVVAVAVRAVALAVALALAAADEGAWQCRPTVAGWPLRVTLYAPLPWGSSWTRGLGGGPAVAVAVRLVGVAAVVAPEWERVVPARPPC